MAFFCASETSSNQKITQKVNYKALTWIGPSKDKAQPLMPDPTVAESKYYYLWGLCLWKIKIHHTSALHKGLTHTTPASNEETLITFTCVYKGKKNNSNLPTRSGAWFELFCWVEPNWSCWVEPNCERFTFHLSLLGIKYGFLWQAGSHKVPKDVQVRHSLQGKFVVSFRWTPKLYVLLASSKENSGILLLRFTCRVCYDKLWLVLHTHF